MVSSPRWTNERENDVRFLLKTVTGGGGGGGLTFSERRNSVIDSSFNCTNC